MHPDIQYMLALKEVDGVGGIIFRQLLANFGSAKEVIYATEGKLLKVQGIGKGLVAEIKKAEGFLLPAEKQINTALKKNQKIISFLDEAYPLRLKSLYDAPPILFLSGKGNLNFGRTVGIVGTRKPTDYGKEITTKIVADLKKYGVGVVSGLAYGIDIAAHKAALVNDMPTFAVMAGGLDKVYPTAHSKYIKEIEVQGNVISENSNDVIPVAPQFIARNRIIAGLSDAVIVVESAKRGGGLVTAEYGNNYHREVFAVPGGLNQPYSEGPNNLIRQHKAQIFTSADELADVLNWAGDGSAAVPTLDKLAAPDLSRYSDDESAVVSLLHQKGEYHIDEISFETHIPLNKLASLLLNLEFQDVVKALPGKKFKLK